MTRTPPTVSLIGITLTVLALATGSWLSNVQTFQPKLDWMPDVVVDVQAGDTVVEDAVVVGSRLPTSC